VHPNDIEYGDCLLDNDFVEKGKKPTMTIRQEMLANIEGIKDIVRNDTQHASVNPLKDKGDLLMVQLTPDVIRVVVSLWPTVVQWGNGSDTKAEFKVVCSITPQVRGDYAGNFGIVRAVR
jgi:hypothetical protein